MNRILKLATLIIPVTLLASCCGVGNRFETVELDEQFALEDGRTDTLFLSLKADYPKTNKFDENIAKRIESALNASLFSRAYEDMPHAEAIDTWVEQNAHEYRASNLELIQIMEEDGESTDFPLSWEYDKQGTAGEIYKNFCNYAIVSYYYSGGAHGISYEKSLVFNLDNGDLLTSKDVFAEGYEKPVTELLKKHINDGREDDLAEFSSFVQPNANFAITEQGFTFTYDPYEIAPFSYGIVKIMIPAAEIKPYLNPEMKIY